MLKNNYISIYVLLIFGIILRLLIFIISPPSNSYDNHLEAIYSYATQLERPAPFSCWECYQPPLYYSISALTYNASQYAGLSKNASWKLVQLLNPIFSILMLLLILKIFDLFGGISQLLKLLYFSFIIILPRDIFTSAMIGNDYLLVLLSIASLYFYFRYVLNDNKISDFIWMSVFVVLGGLTKQHGLLLLLLPSVILIHNLKQLKMPLKEVLLFILIATVLIIEESWKYYHTGFFMVSNQQYFDYAINQFPGQLDKVEFFSFRLFDLIKEPFISKSTAASFPTEIFARIFFDYEYRFFSPKFFLVKYFGRISYIIGLIWFLFLIITPALKNKYKSKVDKNILISTFPYVLGFLFLLVPVIQTIRYPYYSSMKAMFLLPGLIILIITHANNNKTIQIHSGAIFSFILLNIVYGVLFINAISLYVTDSLDQLLGPLWPIP